MVWCKRRFEMEFSKEVCRLFPTQKMLFEFMDSAEQHAAGWLPFSIELPSEEDTCEQLSALWSTPSPCGAAGTKRQRESFSLLYGSGALSQQTRHFLAATKEGLLNILEKIRNSSDLHLYEIIREGSPCHLYLDVECEGNVDVSCEYITVDDSDDDHEVQQCSNTPTRLLVVPAQPGYSKQTYSISSYLQLLVGVPATALPPACCPLSCPCIRPNHNSTTDTLLKELYNFTLAEYPRLLEGSPSVSEDVGALPVHYRCWKEILVMRSRAIEESSTASRDGAPSKFSQHYVIKMYGKIWGHNLCVGVFVKEFVGYLSNKISGTILTPKAEQLHAALFFHSGVKMWSTLHSSSVTADYHRGSALPFLTHKCVIDTAVYSKNRMMRCLRSSKLHRHAFLDVEMFIRESRTMKVELPSGEIRKEQRQVSDVRLLGMLLNSLIVFHPALFADDVKSMDVVMLDVPQEKPKVFAERNNSFPANNSPADEQRSNSTAGGSELVDLMTNERIRKIEEQLSSMTGRSCSLSSSPLQKGAYLMYHVQGSRYCPHVRREHKSNGVYIVIDTAQQNWFQKCFDPDCAHFRGPRISLE